MANSTARTALRKPHPDFPLTPRADGRWAKKVRGKVHMFSGTADEALAEWLRVRDDLLAGRTPRPVGGLTVEDLADHFLNSKRQLVASGELTARTMAEYDATCERLVKVFGLPRLVDDLVTTDFDNLRAGIAKKWGPVRLGNEIQRVRSIFKFGFEAGHIDRPVRFGPAFKKPSRKVMRKPRAARGPRVMEAADIRTLFAKAGVQLRAMILLACNGGLGNSDVGNMPLSALDLKKGWCNYPRPKTGIDRRFPLWPETIAALQAVLSARPPVKDSEAEGLVFVTKYGKPWAKHIEDNPVCKEFRKLLLATNLHRPGNGFYTLRHVFQTVADEARDPVATSHIMGHATDDMASTYRERISDQRLQAVVEHVRGWLFAEGGAT